MKSQKHFAVQDIIDAGFSLAPMKCVHCDSEEVEFNQYIHDAYCANCGKWQAISEEELKL